IASSQSRRKRSGYWTSSAWTSVGFAASSNETRAASIASTLVPEIKPMNRAVIAPDAASTGVGGLPDGQLSALGGEHLEVSEQRRRECGKARVMLGRQRRGIR